MRDHLRVTTLSLTFLALLAGGPLAAAADPMDAVAALTAADQDSARSTAWLHELLSWLEGVFASAGFEAAPASTTSKASASSPDPARLDPDFDVSPQAGPAVDPNG